MLSVRHFALLSIYVLISCLSLGDNSRPELLSPNPYHGWYTTQATNGFDGIYVVPRHATDVFYDSSLPINIEQIYNHMYGTSLDYKAISALDVTMALGQLLAFRHDPFMFHQANLREITVDGQQTSLLTHWVDSVVAAVKQYSLLPCMYFNTKEETKKLTFSLVHSHPHYKLAEMLHEREARDACGFSGTLEINENFQIFAISAQSEQTCRIAVSGATAVATAGTENEADGPERTVWLGIRCFLSFSFSFSFLQSILSFITRKICLQGQQYTFPYLLLSNYSHNFENFCEIFQLYYWNVYASYLTLRQH